jgi:hypothetical protein
MPIPTVASGESPSCSDAFITGAIFRIFATPSNTRNANTNTVAIPPAHSAAEETVAGGVFAACEIADCVFAACVIVSMIASN